MKRDEAVMKAGVNCSSKVSSNDNSKIDTPSTATTITTNCLDTKEMLMSPESSNSITGNISESLKCPTKVDFDISSSIINDSFSGPLPVSASAPGSLNSTNKNSKHEQQKDKFDQVILDKYSKEIKNYGQKEIIYTDILKNLKPDTFHTNELAKIIKSVSLILALVLINLIYYLTTLKMEYQNQVLTQCRTKTNY